MAALAGFAGAACGAPAPGVAQSPFGYFFDGPREDQRLYASPRRRRSPSPREVEIPTPVPRPHFPDDPPSPAPVTDVPTTSPAGPIVEPDLGREDVPPTADTVPLPPPKPIELGGAPSPADVETHKPAGDGVSAKPPEPVKPAAPDVTDRTPKGDSAAKPAEPKAPETGTPPSEPARNADVPPPPGPVAPVPPAKPAELTQPAGVPSKPASPAVAPSGARLGEAPGQPNDDAACPGRLKAHAVDAEPISIGPQPDPRCTVVQAVRLAGLTMPDGGKVVFPEHPTVACTTAETFSSYIRDLLSPLAKGTYGAPVAAVWTGPGLECRSRDHIFGAKLSAHGQGLAIDIAQLKLGDGKMVEVGSPKSDADSGFETAARAGACGYFHTVLGPGSDSYHRTHWHFDLEVRGAHGDSKYCK